MTGAYQTLKFRYEYQWAYKMWHMGVDEFTGGNNDIAAYNHYSSALNSTDGDVATVWNTYYGLIEQTNIVIQNVPLYYNQGSANYNTRLGEGYFLRAYGYFELVKLFGGVPLKLEPANGKIQTYFTRASEEDCYKQIIADFEQAYNLLSATASQTGRITKSAAAHFLAKAHLFRASEANDKWNSSYKSSDLDAVIKYGKEVLAAHPCATTSSICGTTLSQMMPTRPSARWCLQPSSLTIVTLGAVSAIRCTSAILLYIRTSQVVCAISPVVVSSATSVLLNMQWRCSTV